MRRRVVLLALAALATLGVVLFRALAAECTEGERW